MKRPTRPRLVDRVIAWQDAAPSAKERAFRELLDAARPLLGGAIASFRGAELPEDEVRQLAAIGLWIEAGRWDRTRVPPDRAAYLPASCSTWLRRGVRNHIRKALRNGRLVRAVPASRVSSLDVNSGEE